MQFKELIDSTKWYALLMLIALFLVPVAILSFKVPVIDAWQMSFVLFFAIFLFVGYRTRKKENSNNTKSAILTLASYLFARVAYIVIFLTLYLSEKYLTPPSLDKVTDPAIITEFLKLLFVAFTTETFIVAVFSVIAGWVGAYAAEKL